MLLIRRFIIGIAGRKHHALDAQLHHLVEEGAHAVGIGAVKQRRVGCDAETALQRFFDSRNRQVVATFAANRKIVVFALAVHVNGKGQILARLEKIQLLLQKQGIRAEIDVLLARNESLDDLVDLWVHQRLAAGDGNHRRPAFIHGLEALLRAQFRLQNVRGVLDLSATGACQVAAEKRLEHQHKRVAFVPCNLLLEDVRGDRPHL